MSSYLTWEETHMEPDSDLIGRLYIFPYNLAVLRFHGGQVDPEP